VNPHPDFLLCLPSTTTVHILPLLSREVEGTVVLKSISTTYYELLFSQFFANKVQTQIVSTWLNLIKRLGAYLGA